MPARRPVLPGGAKLLRFPQQWLDGVRSLWFLFWVALQVLLRRSPLPLLLLPLLPQLLRLLLLGYFFAMLLLRLE